MSFFDYVLNVAAGIPDVLLKVPPLEQNPFRDISQNSRNTATKATQERTVREIYLDSTQSIDGAEQAARAYHSLCIWANGTIKDDEPVLDEIITKWFPGVEAAVLKKKLMKYEGTVQSRTYHIALEAVRKLVDLSGDNGDSRDRWLASAAPQRKEVFLSLLRQDPVPILEAVFSDFELVPFAWLFGEGTPEAASVWRVHAERRFVSLCEAIYKYVFSRDDGLALDTQLLVYDEMRDVKWKDTPGGADVDWRDMPALQSIA